MRRVLVVACCGLGLGLAAPAGAPAAGGPVPPLQGGAGVSAPGGGVNYVAIGAGRKTVIERVRRAGGAVERSRVLRGSFGVPGVAYDGSSTGLSADGRTLVLAETVSRYPVEQTRLVVLDARRLRVRVHVALPGYFAVDAISPTGRWLYLIHYTSARDLTRYEVRAYDLPGGHLVRKPVIDPREPDEAMRGLPITRAVSADGRWAYTLYQRPEEAPFMHALDTVRRTAVCVDLPRLAGSDLSGLRLRLGRGGGTLRVESEAGPQALVDTRTFAVGRPAVPQPPSPTRRSGAPDDGHDGGLPWPLIAIPFTALAALAAMGWRRRVVAARSPGQ